MNESTPLVEICVTTSSSFARDLVVTAITGPKSGALNQATGKTTNRCSQVESVHGVVYCDLVDTDCCFRYTNLSGYVCTFLTIRRLIINSICFHR